MRIGSSADDNIARWARLQCLLAGIALAAALPFLVAALLRLEFTSDDVRPWFPEGTQERRDFAAFTEAFGADDYLLISLQRGEQQGRRDSEDLRRLARQLERDGAENGLVRSAMHPDDLLERFSTARAGSARAALRGVLIGDDGERVCILVRSTARGLGSRSEVYDAVLKTARRSLDAEVFDRLRLTGPVVLSREAERETANTFRLVTPITFVLGLAVAFVLLRNLKLILIALFTSSMAACGALAVIQYCTGGLSDMLSVIPSLAQLLAMSNAIHLINYYADSDDTEHREGRAWHVALRKGVRPTIGASATTIIGLLSLRVASVPAVREFALYGALGVACSMVTVLLFVPAGLLLSRPRCGSARWLRALVTEPMRRISSARGTVTSLVLVSLAIAMSLGLLRLAPDVRAESFFSERSKFRQDLEWFEREFGPLQPIDLMFSFDDEASTRDRIAFFRAVHGALEESAEPSTELRPFSPWSISSLMPGGMLTARLVPGRVEAGLREFGFVGDAGGVTYWRMTVRHHPEPDPSESRVMPAVVRAIDSASRETGLAPAWRATGTYRLFGTVQGRLLIDLLRSFVLAVLLVAPLTMFILKSVRLGAFAMLGNVFPLAVFFGGLGWLGVRIDIATMMIASVAFGIAVDNTIHFLTWIGRSFRSGAAQALSERVRYAFNHSAAAIVQTTLIIAIGMLAFALSDFLPSRRFALFTSIVLLLALVGDLILLPALMQGPLKRWFHRPFHRPSDDRTRRPRS